MPDQFHQGCAHRGVAQQSGPTPRQADPPRATAGFQPKLAVQAGADFPVNMAQRDAPNGPARLFDPVAEDVGVVIARHVQQAAHPGKPAENFRVGTPHGAVALVQQFQKVPVQDQHTAPLDHPIQQGGEGPRLGRAESVAMRQTQVQIGDHHPLAEPPGISGQFRRGGGPWWSTRRFHGLPLFPSNSGVCRSG